MTIPKGHHHAPYLFVSTHDLIQNVGDFSGITL
ncbi:protein of unknown function [Methylocella tundrae]|nr:protein of unknown function [Methylocella tundrae]